MNDAPRAAAIRYWNSEKEEWVILNPRDPQYRDFIFKYSHYWDGGKWIAVEGTK